MKKFAFLLLFVTSFIYAQEPKKEIYLTEIFERVTQSDEEYCWGFGALIRLVYFNVVCSR